MLDPVHRQRGFTHSRASRQNDQITSVQASGTVIKTIEPRGQAGRLQAFTAPLDFLHRGANQIRNLHPNLVIVAATLGNLEHFTLGLIQQITGVRAVLGVALLDDRCTRPDQLTSYRVLAYDVCPRQNIGRPRGVLHQPRQIRQAAGVVDLAVGFQMFGHRHRIERLVTLGQLGQGLVDQAVFVTVEILGNQAVGQVIPHVGIVHEATDHALLGKQTVRWHLGAGFEIFIHQRSTQAGLKKTIKKAGRDNRDRP